MKNTIVSRVYLFFSILHSGICTIYVENFHISENIHISKSICTIFLITKNHIFLFQSFCKLELYIFWKRIYGNFSIVIFVICTIPFFFLDEPLGFSFLDFPFQTILKKYKNEKCANLIENFFLLQT